MSKHDAKLLEEILDDGCDAYCFAKELLKLTPMSDYMLLQLKMIEKFKWDWSVGVGDIGWEEATKMYTKKYGAKYRELWDRGDFNHHVNSMYWALRKDK